MTAVSLTVNGKPVSADIEDRTLLVYFLREHLRLTGTHIGCDTSQCGACVVHVNGQRGEIAARMFAVQAEGARSRPSRDSRRTASCIRCRKRSAKIMVCNAASARRA